MKMTPGELWWICISFFATTTSALECESYDIKCEIADSSSSVNSTCSSLQQCVHTPGVTPACYAMFGRNDQGELSVVSKGCVQKDGHDCKSSSVCREQENSFGRIPPSLFYCCCTEDRCNQDVLVFVSEKKKEEKEYERGDIQKSIRQLTWLIWAQFVTVAIISGLIVAAWIVRHVFCIKRRHLSSQVSCDKGTHGLQNTSHWTKKDFQLITCLVRSKFGEIWQARPRGSKQVVRIRLSAGSDDVYVYDRLAMSNNTNVHATRIV